MDLLEGFVDYFELLQALKQLSDCELKRVYDEITSRAETEGFLQFEQQRLGLQAKVADKSPDDLA